MKPVYQTRFGEPGGNCFQAAIASLFELDLDAVPDFVNAFDDRWWNEFQAWCWARGFEPIWFPVVLEVTAPEGLEGIDANVRQGLSRLAWCQGYSIVIGRGSRGPSHACVALDGEVAHDPHPNSDGLKNVEGWMVFAKRDELGKVEVAAMRAGLDAVATNEPKSS